MTYRLRRRSFLQGAAATGLAFWLRRTEALAEGAAAPKRLLIMPLARYSIEYQQEQEKMLGRTPGHFYFE